MAQVEVALGATLLRKNCPNFDKNALELYHWCSVRERAILRQALFGIFPPFLSSPSMVSRVASRDSW
jgi:hypothetical protein